FFRHSDFVIRHSNCEIFRLTGGNFMDPLREHSLMMTRRHFFGRTATGIGALALGSLLNPGLLSAMADESSGQFPLGKPHFAPKAKRVIYLFMACGPPQTDLLDYKPTLEQ